MHQIFIAHQVNNPAEINLLIDKNIGLEIDIAFSNTKNDWVVAHHDFDDLQHPSLENWFESLKKALKNTKSSKLHIIWLDIKTPNTNLQQLLDILSRYIPEDITIIYDFGQPSNILDKGYHNIIKPFMGDCDYIASWITKDQLGYVPKLAKDLYQNSIANSIISYGEVEKICKQTLQQLIDINNTINPSFEKVFTWNVESDDEIKHFSKQKGLNGQIVGYKKKPWDNNCLDKLDFFKSFKQ